MAKKPTASATKPEAPKEATAEMPASRQNDIPKTSLSSGITSDLPADSGPQVTEDENATPAQKAGIGLIKVDGNDFRYVGVAPARDKDATTDAGQPINPQNSTFTPLDQVPFHPSIRIKDPKSGEFYFPADGCTSWGDCELNGSKLF
jgi:hypothetical protein